MRLIDADELSAKFEVHGECRSCHNCEKFEQDTINDCLWNKVHTKHEICSALTDADEIEAVPVIHAKWVFGTSHHSGWMKCSECLVSQMPGSFTYCPNCGARMDGEE